MIGSGEGMRGSVESVIIDSGSIGVEDNVRFNFRKIKLKFR